MRLRESFHALTQKARHFLKEDVEGAPREPVGTGAVTSLTPFIEPTLMHDNLINTWMNRVFSLIKRVWDLD